MRIFSQAKRLCSGAIFMGVVLVSNPAIAQQATNIVIGNDLGGVISTKANVVDRIRALRQSVRIKGPMCYSSCTMYLGSGDVCVEPNVTFGFHGPSSFGRPLQPQDFEYWSQIIANHYPAQLSNWFMTTGRHRINGYYKVSGAQLIKLGVRQC
jgi:hypothetical protein